jgi:prevent-host-death family protein
MTRIGIRELRQHASVYLDKVKAGEVVEVTERGMLVALLVPPSPSATERDRLVSTGRLAPARTDFQLPERRDVASDGPTASEVLSGLREDRRA